MLLAIILNTSVSNATVFIRLAVVILVPIVDHPQSSLSLPSPCLPSPSPHYLSLPTPVQFDRLEFLLSGYSHSIAEFLSKGLRDCFPLHYEGIRVSSDAINLLSASDNPEVDDAKLKKGMRGWPFGWPFSERSRSSISVIISDAIQHIKATGPGCFIAKTNIKNAFRIIPTLSQDDGLLNIRWKGLYYYYRCVPMGCSSSCRTLEILSSAVE